MTAATSSPSSNNHSGFRVQMRTENRRKLLSKELGMGIGALDVRSAASRQRVADKKIFVISFVGKKKHRGGVRVANFPFFGVWRKRGRI